MKTTARALLYGLCMFLLACGNSSTQKENTLIVNQTELQPQAIKDYVFLDCMYQDSYFPTFLVDKCKAVLLQLCHNIESSKPSDLEELYKLSHAATERINDLEEEFFAHDSEIETGARECLAENFYFIAQAYGFESADMEALIATREW